MFILQKIGRILFSKKFSSTKTFDPIKFS